MILAINATINSMTTKNVISIWLDIIGISPSFQKMI